MDIDMEDERETMGALELLTAPQPSMPDRDQKRALEVYQTWGEVILDGRIFRSGSSNAGNVSIGSGSALKWSFLGVDMGVVPEMFGPLLSLAPLWSDVSWSQRHEFALPNGDEIGWDLFRTEGDRFFARVPADDEPPFTGRALVGGSWVSLDAAARRETDGDGRAFLEIDLEDVEKLVIEQGAFSFVASKAMVKPRAEVRGLRDLEPSFLGPLALSAVIFLAAMMFSQIDMGTPTLEERRSEDRVVTIVPATDVPRPAQQRDGTGGGQPKAKSTPKPTVEQPRRSDKEVASSAGLVGALDRLDLAATLGPNLSSALSDGVSKLIGASGAQIGGHGLAGRGGSGLCVASFGCDGGYEGSSFGVGGGDRLGHGGGGNGIQKQDGVVETDQPPILLGNLTREEIDEVIKNQMSALRYCYQRELQKDPTLGGKIVIKFTIAKDGTVSSAQARSSTIGSSSVEQCLVGRFLRMKFPQPRGGGQVFVSYPFLFSSR